MANLSPLQGTTLFTRGIDSYMTDRPIVVSYKVTIFCNRDCRNRNLVG